MRTLEAQATMAGIALAELEALDTVEGHRLEDVWVFFSNVQPKRRVLPTPSSWRCSCPNPEGRSSRFKTNPGYLVACSDCDSRRPA